jgi:hypothetical protein
VHTTTTREDRSWVEPPDAMIAPLGFLSSQSKGAASSSPRLYETTIHAKSPYR